VKVKRGFFWFYFFICFLTPILFAVSNDKIKEKIMNYEYEEAIALIEYLYLIEEYDDETVFLHAQALYNMGKIDKAREILEDLMKKGYKSTEVLNQYSIILLDLGNYNKLKSDFLDKLGKDYKFYASGLISLNSGNRNKAKFLFAKIHDKSELKKFISDIFSMTDKNTYGFVLEYGNDTNPVLDPLGNGISGVGSNYWKGDLFFTYDGMKSDFAFKVSRKIYTQVVGYDVSEGLVKFTRYLENQYTPMTARVIFTGSNFYLASATVGIGYYLGMINNTLNVGFKRFYEPKVESEDRTGPSVSFSSVIENYGGSYFFEFGLIGGYDLTRGKNWESYSLGMTLISGIQVGRVSFYLDGKLISFQYLHENSLYLQKRSDLFLKLVPFAEISIYNGFTVKISYKLQENRSTIEDYSYKKREFSLGIVGEF
jgi:tetratricopeptide (TPR) repeat protein